MKTHLAEAAPVGVHVRARHYIQTFATLMLLLALTVLTR